MSQDGSTPAMAVEGEALDRTLDRVRALLTMSVSNKGPVPRWLTRRRKADIMLQRWKAMFVKHDKLGQGMLELKDMKRLVRVDLKLVERLVSDEQLALLFDSIDVDSGGQVDFQEFFRFVNQPRKRRQAEEEEAYRNVARAVRLSLHRNKCTVADLEYQFHVFDSGDDSHEFSPSAWRRFFRMVLKVTPHDCSDRNLNYAFGVIDVDGSGSISKEEFHDFLQQSCRKDFNRPSPGGAGTMDGARVWPEAGSHLRGSSSLTAVSCPPSTAPASAPKALARQRSSHGTLPRLDPAGTANSLFQTAAPCGAPASPGLTFETTLLPPTSAPGVLTGSLGATAPPPFGSSGRSLRSAQSSPGLGSPQGTSSSPRGMSPSNATVAGSMSPPSPSSKVSRLPSNGRYSTIKGGNRLNNIEERLFEAGIDLRGRYYRPSTLVDAH